MPGVPRSAPATSPRVALGAFFRLAKRWGLTRAQQRQLLGISERTLYRWDREPATAEVSRDTRERISYLIGIFAGLHRIFGDNDPRADAWIRRPNTDLGGQSALDRMLAGRITDLATVRQLVDRAVTLW